MHRRDRISRRKRRRRVCSSVLGGCAISVRAVVLLLVLGGWSGQGCCRRGRGCSARQGRPAGGRDAGQSWAHGMQEGSGAASVSWRQLQRQGRPAGGGATHGRGAVQGGLQGLGLAALAALGQGDAGACGGWATTLLVCAMGHSGTAAGRQGQRRRHLFLDVQEEGEQGREEKLGPATRADETRCAGSQVGFI
jgi:hypothetical protein